MLLKNFWRALFLFLYHLHILSTQYLMIWIHCSYAVDRMAWVNQNLYVLDSKLYWSDPWHAWRMLASHAEDQWFKSTSNPFHFYVLFWFAYIHSEIYSSGSWLSRIIFAAWPALSYFITLYTSKIRRAKKCKACSGFEPWTPWPLSQVSTLYAIVTTASWCSVTGLEPYRFVSIIQVCHLTSQSLWDL